jgi:hypothetical protein
MDFRQTVQPNSRPAGTPAPVGQTPTTSSDSPKKAKRLTSNNKWLNLMSLIVLLGVAGLVITIAVMFSRTTVAAEYELVEPENYQAVFLNNGQVYFGDITELNSQYVRLNNIYYLTQTTSTDPKAAASSDYTLVKLGCQQIHSPFDQMVINREQVTFWENLSDDGKVVTSINDFIKQNPKGPDCTQVSNQTQASPSTGTQGATTPKQ